MQPTHETLQGLIPLDSLRAESRAHLARTAIVQNHGVGQVLAEGTAATDQALYLLEGSVELLDADDEVKARMNAGSPEALRRLPGQAHGVSRIRCTTNVRCLVVNGRLLDVMLTWDQSDMLEVGVVEAESRCESDDWMMRLLHTRAFQMVPPANLQAIFLRMERIAVTAGEIVVRQGDEGDYFYVIVDGRCIVTRERPGQKSVRLADLEAGDSFGEEALISDAPRNATVTLLTGGCLMRLAKRDFNALLEEPLTRRLSFAEANALVRAGKARYLDVRLPSEFGAYALPDSLNIPLYMLRLRLPPQDAGSAYVCVCDTGRRSAVASFVLTQKGYEAYLLADGIGIS
ncbi:MAG: cyclic nucleotide-binding domain-containing protein [Panacagrimonas sp.]